MEQLHGIIHITPPLILFTSYKTILRIMNFSRFDAHSGLLFKLLNIIKLYHLVRFHTLVYMFKYYNGFPPAFDHFFTPVKTLHTYNARSAANQSLHT